MVFIAPLFTLSPSLSLIDVPIIRTRSTLRSTEIFVVMDMDDKKDQFKPWIWLL